MQSRLNCNNCFVLVLLLAVVVHRRKQDNYNDKDMDDIRENIINYEDEGGGEVDTGFDLNVLRRENYFDDPHTMKPKEGIYGNGIFFFILNKIFLSIFNLILMIKLI